MVRENNYFTEELNMFSSDDLRKLFLHRDRIIYNDVKYAFDCLVTEFGDNLGYRLKINIPENVSNKHSIDIYSESSDKKRKYSFIINRKSLLFSGSGWKSIQGRVREMLCIKFKDLPNQRNEMTVTLENAEDAANLMRHFLC
jgi:hypothetical protein